MNQTQSAPTLASVVFLKVQEFAGRSVAEQAQLRAQLEAVVGVAISGLPAEDRILLDTPDGAAVIVLANPSGALEVAEQALAAATGLPLCIGVNHGIIKLATDEQNAQGFVGDGIAAAATAADFASPTRLLMSRSFQEALAEDAPDLAVNLRPAGVFTDSRVRTHELLTSDKGAAVSRSRRLLVIGVASVIGLLGTGAVLRDAVHRNRISGPSAVLDFDIAPHGEVFIDGEPKGKSPPLTQMKVSPGSHTIEVRNGSHPPLMLDVDLKAGEQMTIQHSFSTSTPGELFRGFRKKLGF